MGVIIILPFVIASFFSHKALETQTEKDIYIKQQEYNKKLESLDAKIED
jgi:hypothetical protein